jgi:hypothetical protein
MFGAAGASGGISGCELLLSKDAFNAIERLTGDTVGACRGIMVWTDRK